MKLLKKTKMSSNPAILLICSMLTVTTVKNNEEGKEIFQFIYMICMVTLNY